MHLWRCHVLYPLFDGACTAVSNPCPAIHVLRFGVLRFTFPCLASQVNDGDNLIQPIDARNVAEVLMAIVDDPVSQVQSRQESGKAHPVRRP